MVKLKMVKAKKSLKVHKQNTESFGSPIGHKVKLTAQNQVQKDLKLIDTTIQSDSIPNYAMSEHHEQPQKLPVIPAIAHIMQIQNMVKAMYCTQQARTVQPVSLDPAVPLCSLEEEKEPTKSPIHIIKLGPNTETIQILGSRLVTNELLEYGLNEQSHEIPHDATKGETPRKEVITQVKHDKPLPFEKLE